MTRISSKWTFYHKHVFPAIWFGAAGVAVLVAVAHRNAGAFLLTVLMVAAGYVIMRSVVFDLVDEVWDCGDALLVRNQGEERRIALVEVMNVNYSGVHSPPRITLTLRPSADIGEAIPFIPAPSPMRSFSISLPYVFSMPPIAKDLMCRIDSARVGVDE